MTSRLLFAAALLFGLAVSAVSGLYALADYRLLIAATESFGQAAAARDAVGLQIADARQLMHRLNLAAEGTWCLLGALLAVTALPGVRSRNPGAGNDQAAGS